MNTRWPILPALVGLLMLSATSGTVSTQSDGGSPLATSFPSVDKEGTRRQPGGGAAFGPVSLNWFVSQSDTPLAPTRGQLVDHIAVSVPALDPWIAKLKAENVTFLQQPYSFGEMRAIMIEGPSREAIEIIGK